MRALYRLAPDVTMVPAGQAVRAFLEGVVGREEVLAAVGFAREGSRFGAWLEAVAGAVQVSSLTVPLRATSRPSAP